MFSIPIRDLVIARETGTVRYVFLIKNVITEGKRIPSKSNLDQPNRFFLEIYLQKDKRSCLFYKPLTSYHRLVCWPPWPKCSYLAFWELMVRRLWKCWNVSASRGFPQVCRASSALLAADPWTLQPLPTARPRWSESPASGLSFCVFGPGSHRTKQRWGRLACSLQKKSGVVIDLLFLLLGHQKG